MTGPANRRRFVVLSLLIAGAGGFVWIYGENFLTLGLWGAWPLCRLVVAALLAALLPVNRVRLPRQRGASIVAAMAAVVYLLITAREESRRFSPLVHDEFSYLIQAHQLARGRLWMPAHPLAVFFDSFQLLVHPVYASIYFPGTALLYVPGIWLHLPSWVTTMAIVAAVIFLLHRITAELISPLAAWLAVLLLVCCPIFRTLSLMTMSQLPLLFYVLLATMAFLNWRRSGRPGWTVLLGASLGLAAITRPIDALCFAIPLAIAVATQLRRQSAKALIVAKIVLSAVPFLCIQLIADRGITGHLFQTPFQLYADADYPGTALGFHDDDPAARPQSPLPQKQDLYVKEVLPLIERHQLQYLSELLFKRIQLTLSLGAAAPFPLLVILLPLALADRRRFLLSPLVLFVGLYVFYVFFFPHYTIVVAPVIIGGILIGADQLQPRLRAAAYLCIVVMAIAALPQLDPTMKDDMFKSPLLTAIDAKLAGISGPSIVLFTYSPVRDIAEEPVYNADVAWPDEARIIRAHDLGARNREIFRYYADRQAQRRIYRFDESDYSLQYIGTAGELAYNQN